MSVRRTALPFAALSLLLAGRTDAADPDWNAVGAEAAALLAAYIRIDTANPPGRIRPNRPRRGGRGPSPCPPGRWLPLRSAWPRRGPAGISFVSVFSLVFSFVIQGL